MQRSECPVYYTQLLQNAHSPPARGRSRTDRGAKYLPLGYPERGLYASYLIRKAIRVVGVFTQKMRLYIPLLLILGLGEATAAGLNWNQLSPSGTLPAGRAAVSSINDSTAHQMIVFGGQYVDGGGFHVLGDVWSLSTSGNGQWTQVSPAGTPPPGKYGASAVYDSSHSRMIIFGGEEASFTFSNDVWILSNATGTGGTPTWNALTTAGTAPAARAFQSGVYDASSNELIIFGGTSQSGVLNDVWVLSNANGLGGTATWSQLSVSGTPPTARNQQVGVYDPFWNRLIIFGGIGAGSPPQAFNDVWVLSNANGIGGTPAWTQLTPTGTPPAGRGAAASIYLPGPNELILFGGTNAGSPGTVYNDTWVLYNANGVDRAPVWAQPSVFGPALRDLATAVYDAPNRRMILFGGYNTAYLNDTWALHVPLAPILFLQNQQNNGVSEWLMGGPNSTVPENTPWFATAVAGWSLCAAADMNGDGVPDLVFQNTSTGGVSIWFMTGTTGLTIGASPILYTAGPNWQVVAAADMNGDGVPDLLLQNSVTNQISIWFMNAGGLSFSSAPVIATAASGWRLVATGDINQDGVPDLLLQNQTTGQISVWFMNPGGLSYSSAPTVASPASGWSLVGTSDFNSDGVPDYVFQNRSTGDVSVWYMTGTQGTTYSSAPVVGTAASGWYIRASE